MCVKLATNKIKINSKHVWFYFSYENEKYKLDLLERLFTIYIKSSWKGINPVKLYYVCA